MAQVTRAGRKVTATSFLTQWYGNIAQDDEIVFGDQSNNFDTIKTEFGEKFGAVLAMQDGDTVEGYGYQITRSGDEYTVTVDTEKQQLAPVD